MNINDLPPEILSEIFLWAYDEKCTIELGKSRQRYVNAMHRRWPPFSLIHVCRHWRETALSIEPLWTSLRGDDPTPTAMEHWLSFSHSNSLRLAIAPMAHKCPHSNERIVSKAKKMLQLFARHSTRWESFYFSTGHHDISKEFISTFKNCAPASPLRSLEIYLLNVPRSMIDELIPSIASLPLLRHFYWMMYTFNSTIPHIFPWETLETVYIESAFQVDEAIWCLMHCISAKEVTLLAHRQWATGDEPPEDVMGTYKHTTLPNLKLLVLDNNCNPSAMLQYFTLPALSSLRVISSRGCVTSVEEFLNRSKCPLRKLIINKGYIYITEVDILGYISIPYLKSVGELHICTHQAHEQFQSIIQAQADILRKVPGLRTWNGHEGSVIGWKESPKKYVY